MLLIFVGISFFSSAFLIFGPKWCVVSRIVVDQILLTESPACPMRRIDNWPQLAGAQTNQRQYDGFDFTAGILQVDIRYRGSSVTLAK